MALLVNDAELERELIADRQARGIDQFDEVWDGVYVMAPIANDEHQDLVAGLVIVFGILIKLPGLGEVRPGANVSDQQVDWTHNYRCPDVLVFLNDTTAENRDTHWFGGPDLAIEIVSPRDRAREKIPFYSQVGVRELLIIDRDPWQIEVFRPDQRSLKSDGTATVQNGQSIQSEVTPVSLKLIAGQRRPRILIQSLDGQSWTI